MGPIWDQYAEWGNYTVTEGDVITFGVFVDNFGDSNAAWSKCSLGGAPARLLRLLRARLAALDDVPSQGEKSSHRLPRHASSARASRLQSRRFHRLWPFRQKGRTKIVPKSLNPEWDESFIFAGVQP